MNEARAVTPARERKLRQLDAIAEQLRQDAIGLGETINRLHDERRRAAENVVKIEKDIDLIERDQRHAAASERKRLSEDLAKAQEPLKHERARDQDLVNDIDEYTRRQEQAQQGWQRGKALVAAVLGAFGPAGQDVSLRMRGKA